MSWLRRISCGPGLAVAMATLPGSVLGQEFPRPPCGAAPAQPGYPAPGAAPVLRSWQVESWTPPDCAGWSSTRATLLVAIAGTFRHEGGAEDLLAGFGRISGLAGIRYWSVGDAAWRPLVTHATALEGPSGNRRRPDFSPGEMEPGRDLYFSQSDSRSSGAVVYRMRVLDRRPGRVVVHLENASPVRLLLVPLFGPGDLQATFFLERRSPGIWGYYGLWGIRTGTLTSGHEASSLNRALAMYRHTAGIRTDQEPPAARR